MTTLAEKFQRFISALLEIVIDGAYTSNPSARLYGIDVLMYLGRQDELDRYWWVSVGLI